MSNENKTFLIVMSSGALIVGKVNSETDSHLILHKPHVLFVNDAGAPTLAQFIPYFKDDNIPFNKNSIDVSYDANGMLSNLYFEKTTHLKAPSPKKLILE